MPGGLPFLPLTQSPFANRRLAATENAIPPGGSWCRKPARGFLQQRTTLCRWAAGKGLTDPAECIRCAEKQNVTSRLHALGCSGHLRADGADDMLALQERGAGERMFSKEILSKTQWICARLGDGVAGCRGRAFGAAQMYLRAETGGRMVLRIVFFDIAHGGSSRPVACLKDARLERNLECRRREGGKELLFQAYAYTSLRAADFLWR